jgi:hypothetical protein
MKMLQRVAGEWQFLAVDVVMAGDPGFAYGSAHSAHHASRRRGVTTSPLSCHRTAAVDAYR